MKGQVQPKAAANPEKEKWEIILDKTRAKLAAINEARKKQQLPPVAFEKVEVVKRLPEALTPEDVARFKPLVDEFTTIPEGYKNETILALKKLAFFDSIHDFWPKRGGKPKKAITDVDADAPIDIVDNSIIDAVHTRLVANIASYVGAAPKEKDPSAIAAAILRSTTNSEVGSVHGIEEKVLAYFKKNFAPFNEPERIIKVSEILSNWSYEKNYKSSWPSYSAAIKQLPANLVILIDNTYVKSLDTPQLGIVGFFILAYMNPDQNPGSKEVFLTFDMAPRDIGKIFARFDQVKNAIYPQNVADSATTSFTSLEGRSVFFRANDTRSVGQPKDVLRHRIYANTFTRDRYTLEFVDKGFSNKNRFGFSIEVKENTKGKPVGTINFAPGKGEQGPSVNYLMELLSKGNANALREVQPKDKVAKLDTLNVYDEGLLFDIKRLGDQEQMRVKNAYGVTGDHFASAFRRLLRAPGIFHSTKGYRLWRAPPKAVSPAEAAKQIADAKARALEFRKSKVVSKLKIITGVKGIGDQVTEVQTNLGRMYDEITKGFEMGKVFNEPISLTDINADLVSIKYSQIASTFATILLRLRMKDMLEQISLMIAKIDGLQFTLADIDEAACSITQPKPSDPTVACLPEQSKQPVEAALDTLEAFIEGIKELDAMNISFVSDTEVSPIYSKLFDDSGYLLKGSTSILFNFSAAPFLHPETGIAAVVGRILDIANTTRPSKVATRVNSLLVSYFQARDTIKEAFLDQGLKEEVEQLTDISSGLSVSDIITVGKQGGLVDAIQRTAEVAESFGISGMAGGGISVAMPQTGGAGSPLQYRDLHDLFFELCREAQLALEDGEDPVSALDDIEVTWITEIHQLRDNSVEVYGTPYEESSGTQFISYLLSFRKDSEPLFKVPEGITARDMRPFTQITDALKPGGVPRPDVEEFILKVLASLAVNVLSQTQRYVAPEKWPEIAGTINAIAPLADPFAIGEEGRQRMLGGSLEEGGDTLPNDGGSSGGSSRPRLYAGLRKRSGSGSPSEL